MKSFFKNSTVNFFVLIFLNAALFEDHRADLSLPLNSSYQPVTLAEFLLEALGKRDIPAGDQEELDEFRSISQRHDRLRISLVPGSFHILDNPFQLLISSEGKTYSTVYQQFIFLSSRIAFSEAVRTLHLRKLF
ncbi:MAG: hypothetical protein KF687_12005 [Cyclobacteriaceae bacterium]|nr:hypothetical protein [Cyclobacteriaceae bacterium]